MIIKLQMYSLKNFKRPLSLLLGVILWAIPCAFAAEEKTQDMSVDQMSRHFNELSDMIRREYVEEPDNKKLLEGAFEGMMSSLDPHSIYLNPEKYKMLKDHSKGSFGGIGIEVFVGEQGVQIISVLEEGPGYKAGLNPQDLIVAVDDRNVVGMNSMEILKLLKGDIGTKVKLTLRRDTAELQKVVVRDKVQVNPIKWKVEDNIGYIRIRTFSEQTQIELLKAIRSIVTQSGNKLIGYVLDLRNNAGGLLDQAVSVSDTFLKGGVIVSIRGRNQKLEKEYKATGHDYTAGKPLVVLIDSGSASASEIVAGALQDNKRALIVGSKSFGKGSVQKVTPLKGEGGALKMTVALFYTPKGRVIQKNGITPDIKIEQQMDMKTINSDKRLREALLEDLIKDQKGESTKVVPSKDDGAKASDSGKTADSNITEVKKEKNFKELPDYQLHQAYNILRAVVLDHAILKGA